MILLYIRAYSQKSVLRLLGSSLYELEMNRSMIAGVSRGRRGGYLKDITSFLPNQNALNNLNWR